MKSAAQRLADHRRETCAREHDRCEQVIVEFGGDREDMAAEILRLRFGLAKVAEVISWVRRREPFAIIPPGLAESSDVDVPGSG
jgi:hypothetical protein